MRIRALLVLILIGSMAVACGSKSPTEPTPSCTATLSPATQTFDGNGGTAAVTVSMAAAARGVSHQVVDGLRGHGGRKWNRDGKRRVRGLRESQHPRPERHVDDCGSGPLRVATGSCRDGLQLCTLSGQCGL